MVAYIIEIPGVSDADQAVISTIAEIRLVDAASSVVFSNKVDYALLLGGTTTNVVFEYTGAGWSSTASRKIALKGTVSRVRCSSVSGGVFIDRVIIAR